jgi:kynurenine formamidase
MTENRRDFFRNAGAAAAAAALSPLLAGSAAADEGRHEGFIKQVLGARIIDLSHTWEKSSPIAGVNPLYDMTLNATHAGTRGTFRDGGKLSFTSEVQHFSGQHGAPSIDAIGHIGREGKLFGGVDAAAATANSDGIGLSGVGAHLDIDHYPVEMLVNRGVLLDVARLVNPKGEPLPPKFEITKKHLVDTARAQRVRVRRGDTVLIRTGWGQYFAGNPELYKGDFSPGVGVDGAQFLVDSGARVVGNDTLTFEQRPPIRANPFEVFPVHMLLIADNGINIIENYNLEGIAAAKEYEFVLVVPPLKIRGGTGSALRSFALVP